MPCLKWVKSHLPTFVSWALSPFGDGQCGLVKESKPPDPEREALATLALCN